MWGNQSVRSHSVDPISRAARFTVEQLEPRVLLSAALISTPVRDTLWINGTAKSDTITLGLNATDTNVIDVVINGTTQQFDKRTVRYIRVNAFGGNDVIKVDETNGRLPVGINVAAGEGSDRIEGSSWRDNIWGEGGNDYLVGNGGDDRMFGMKGNDRVWGGLGDDKVEGNQGNDTLEGSWGNDRLWGNEGNDKIDAGEGSRDFVSGGAGKNNVNDAVAKAVVSMIDRGNTTFADGAQPNQVIATPSGYSVDQMRTAYGFNNLDSSITGVDQAIAVVIAYDVPTARQDLISFSQYYGLPEPIDNDSFEVVYASGTQPIADPGGDNGWALEAMLDLQWAHAIAPDAKLYLVLADSNSFEDIDQAIDVAAATVVDNHGGGVVNMSLGAYTEVGNESTEAIFTNPAYRDVSFVAASGDQGAVISYPGTSPYALSVGGTAIVLDGAGNRVSEVPWEEASGGYSDVFDAPPYQIGLSVVSDKRVSPDVAYNSDPATAVSVFTSFNAFDQTGDGVPDSGWVNVGGTSAAAPQWSGLIALANQVRVENELGYIGEGVIAKLYALGNIDQDQYYTDIVTGSIGPDVYDATPGFDVATGWGAPKADQIVAGLSDGATVGIGVRGFDWKAEYVEAASKYPGGVSGSLAADFRGDGDARIGFTSASLAFDIEQQFFGTLLQITVPTLTRTSDDRIYGLGSATVIGPLTSGFFTIRVSGAILTDSDTGEVQITGQWDSVSPVTGEPAVRGLEELFYGSFSSIQ